MFVGKPRLHRVCVICAGLMLLKDPKMLKRRRALAVPVAQVAWMQWTRVAMVSTALWCGWDLNWVMGMRRCVLIFQLDYLAITFLRSFFMHSRRLMGWYTLGRE